jgi:cation transport ATPase
MGGPGLDFWFRFIFLMAILVIILYSFGALMRRWLKVEKKRGFFSYDHVNKKHEKIDWTIRIIFVPLVLLLFIILSGRAIVSDSEPGWYTWLHPFYLFIVFMVATEGLKAFMEWKYAENKRAYIVTLSELGFGFAVIISMIMTDFWGLL